MAGEAVVEVFLADYRPQVPHVLGPLPAVRHGDVIAYEMQAPECYQPWPGRSRLERKYLLLDIGVSFGIPCWRTHTRADGTSWSFPDEEHSSWYIDLVTVEETGVDTYMVRDLFVDVILSTDGRHPRMLDFDELADAVERGWIPQSVALDGLRRWQQFLDTHVYDGRFPTAEYPDFPPHAITALRDLPTPFGPPVTWPE